jgi:hypothetical protein
VPLLVFVLVLRFIISVLLHVGSVGITGIVLIGIYAIIVSAIDQNWEVVFIMGTTLIGMVLAALVAGIIVALVEELTSQMIEFLFS